MKLLKEIKLSRLLLLSVIVFLTFFIVLAVFSVLFELKNKELFRIQLEANAINKNLIRIKNQQDNIFIHNRNQYLSTSEDLSKFNFQLNSLLQKTDSIAGLDLLSSDDFSVILSNFRGILVKYIAQSESLEKLNEKLYAPNVGIVSQIDNVANKIYKEERYHSLGLIPYFDRIRDLRIQLLSGKLAKREFDKKVNLVFQEMSEVRAVGSDNYFVTLFEEDVTNYYTNTQIEYLNVKELGRNYSEGLLYFLQNSYLILYNNANQFDSLVIQLRDKFFRLSMLRFFILLLLLLLLLVLSFYYFRNLLYLPWLKIKEGFLSLSSGKIRFIELESQVVEYNIFAEGFDEFVKGLKKKNNFINQLANKNYSFEFEVSKDDVLALSLLRLRSELIKSDKESVQYQETERNQKWSATGIAQIGAVMRQNTEDVASLTKNVLRQLIEYINAIQGALYLYNDEKDCLELSASFSYRRQMSKKHTIEPYEGLLGTILIEKREYYYDVIPENYIFLETGLGYSKPKSLFAFPLLFEDRIYGVIEIASMNKIEDFKRNFLLNLAIEIATTISYTKINVQTKLLLEQSKKQAQELQSNEKLFKKNQDNLKSLLRMTEQRLRDKDDQLREKEKFTLQKIEELLHLQKEFSAKEEENEIIANEFENIRLKLENTNEELRQRISDLESRLDKNK